MGKMGEGWGEGREGMSGDEGVERERIRGCRSGGGGRREM